MEVSVRLNCISTGNIAMVKTTYFYVDGSIRGYVERKEEEEWRMIMERHHIFVKKILPDYLYYQFLSNMANRSTQNMLEDDGTWDMQEGPTCAHLCGRYGGFLAEMQCHWTHWTCGIHRIWTCLNKA